MPPLVTITFSWLLPGCRCHCCLLSIATLPSPPTFLPMPWSSKHSSCASVCTILCTRPLGGRGAHALSLSVNLEVAWRGRSVLLADDKKLLREGNEVDLLCNQKGNYEQLKLILIRLECMCISPGPPKRCTWNLMCLVCPIPNAYVGMQSCVEVMMWCWGGRPATS